MTSENHQPKNEGAAICKIEVERLFGQYTYSIPTQPDERELSDVVILYGNNGCGKTTILKLLYNVLLPVQRPGSKSLVGKTRFGRFRVIMRDGTTVTVDRPTEKLLGSYNYRVEKGTEVIKEIYLEADADGAIRPKGPKEEEEFQDLLRALAEMNLGIWFLQDDRRFQSHIYSEDEQERMSRVGLHARYEVERGEIDEDQLSMLLRIAMRRSFDCIKNQALSGSNIGSTNANTIYEEIIKNIVEYPTTELADPSAKVEKVKKVLMTLERRNEQFARLGLTSEFEVGQLIAIMEKGTSESQKIILNVLKPYTEGIKVRLDALEETQQLITTLLENINELYDDKRVLFNINEGLSIVSRTQTPLTPGMLSSGEKQLLLLLCDTIAAREKPSIFIIDEPEISLNVKWQRRLIRLLQDCIKGSSVQFFLATHSIELLTGYKEYVEKLVDAERSHEHNVWRPA